jgi:hypothetical protein
MYSSRPSWSANGLLPKRKIPASRYPTKLEKLFLRPLEEQDDWGDFQLCLLANLNVFDSVSMGLSADSLKSIIYATNATFGNQTILAEFVDYCLGQAHREVDSGRVEEKTTRRVEEKLPTTKPVRTRKTTIETSQDASAEAERWVPSGATVPISNKGSVRPEKLRVESKKQVTNL